MWGLWLGYGVSGSVLACIYIYILTVRIDWGQVALKASKDESEEVKHE